MPKNDTPPKPHSKASNDDSVTLDLRPRERLRVRHHSDLHTVDLRIMEDVNGCGVWLSTKDGVVLPVKAVPGLIAVLQAIAAVKRGRAA